MWKCQDHITYFFQLHEIYLLNNFMATGFRTFLVTSTDHFLHSVAVVKEKL